MISARIHHKLKQLQNANEQKNISENQQNVLLATCSYFHAITNPNLLRMICKTDAKRFEAVEYILDNRNLYDPIFLVRVINKALEIDSKTSDFSDKIGKTALSQLLKFSAGIMELCALVYALQSLREKNISNVLFYIGFCFVIERAENFYQTLLKNKSLPEGLSKILLDLGRSALYEGLYLGLVNRSLAFLQNSGQAPQLITATLSESKKNITDCIENVLNSHWLFLRRTVVGAVTRKNTLNNERSNSP